MFKRGFRGNLLKRGISSCRLLIVEARSGRLPFAEDTSHDEEQGDCSCLAMTAKANQRNDPANAGTKVDTSLRENP
jgi:hypothetical protein